MRQHGFFEITLNKNMLIADFYGAWNFEQTEIYRKAIETEAQPLTKKPWARIVNLTQWEGGGEEVVAPLVATHNWCHENNCQLVLFVNPPLVPKYMLEKYGDPYGPYSIFDNVDDAIAWAIEKLS